MVRDYMRMRRNLTYATVWVGATALAVTVSWLGVRPVLRSAAFGEHAPVTVDVAGRPTQTVITEAPVATVTPKPTATATATAAPPKPRKSPSPKPTRKPAGTIRSFTTIGGYTAVSIGPSSATVVSATPRAGYIAQINETPFLLRIDFVTSTSKSSSVIISWHDHPPLAEIFEY
jgi:hypothetical protein